MELTRVPPLLLPSASGMPDMSRGMLTRAASPVVGSMVATMSTSRRSPPESGRQSEPTRSTVRRPSLPSWTGSPRRGVVVRALPLVGAGVRGQLAHRVEGDAQSVLVLYQSWRHGRDRRRHDITERESIDSSSGARRELPAKRPIRLNGTPSRLHHHQAAVDGEHLARDVRGLVRGEEGDRVGDLLRLTEAAQGRARRELVQQLLGQALGQLRLDEARAPRRCR